MKYFDIHEMIEKSHLTQEIRVALDGVCDLHNHLNDIRNMNEATYLCFVHLFGIDLQPHLESFSLLFLLLSFGHGLLLRLFESCR